MLASFFCFLCSRSRSSLSSRTSRSLSVSRLGARSASLPLSFSLVRWRSLWRSFFLSFPFFLSLFFLRPPSSSDSLDDSSRRKTSRVVPCPIAPPVGGCAFSPSTSISRRPSSSSPGRRDSPKVLEHNSSFITSLLLKRSPGIPPGNSPLPGAHASTALKLENVSMEAAAADLATSGALASDAKAGNEANAGKSAAAAPPLPDGKRDEPPRELVSRAAPSALPLAEARLPAELLIFSGMQTMRTPGRLYVRRFLLLRQSKCERDGSCTYGQNQTATRAPSTHSRPPIARIPYTGLWLAGSSRRAQ